MINGIDEMEEQGPAAPTVVAPGPAPKKAPSLELTLAQQANRAIEAGADPHDVTDRLGTMLRHLKANPEHAAAGAAALAGGADPAAVTSRVWSLTQPTSSSVPPIAAASTGAAPNQAGRRAAMAAEPPLLGTGALRALEQGATFGAGDELNAGVRALVTPETYASAVADERGKNRAYAAAHPVANFGAELAGGAGTLALGGPALRAAGAGVDAVIGTGRLARLAKLLGSGATVGGVAGAGSAEGGLSERASGAAKGAAAGAATAGTLSLAGKALSPLAAALLDRSGLRAPATEVAPVLPAPKKQANWLQQLVGRVGVGSVQDRADELVGRVATKGGRTIDDIRTAATAASPDKPVILADLAGEGAQQLAAGARGFTESAASSKVPAILRGRAEGSGARLSADMTAASETKPVNPYELANQMSEARRTQANALYANAYAHGKVDDATIDELLKLPYFKDAYGFAKNLAKLEDRTLPERITQVFEKGAAPPTPPGFTDEQWATMRARVPDNPELNPPDVVKDVHETVPDVEALDMVKRGIDAHIEKNLARNSIDKAAAVKLQQRLGQFLAKVDAAVPEYGQARAAYHESSRMLDALEKGRKAVNLDPRAAELELRALETPHEQGLYRYGLQDALNQVVNGTRDGAPVAGKLAGTSTARHQLSLIARDAPSADELLRRAGEERAMSETNQRILGGSNTAEKLQGQNTIAGAGGGQELPARITLNPATLVYRALKTRMDAATRGLNAETADAVSARLMSGSTNRAELLKTLDQLEAAQRRGKLSDAKARQILRLPAAAEAGRAVSSP